jgi:hypothetical protein
MTIMTMRTIILFAALLLALGPACGSDAGNQISITVKLNKCSVDPGCGQQMLKLIAYKVSIPLPCLLASKDVEVGSGAGTLEGLDLNPGDSIHIGAALYCSNKTYCLSCGATKQITVAEGSHTLELDPGSSACSLDDSNLTYLLVTPSATCN